MSSPDTHAVLIRPLATNRWGILEYATSAESALAKARKQRDGLSYGDLVLAIDIAEVSAIQERGECLYFVNKIGEIKKAPKALGEPTWFLIWEGPNADAWRMLSLSRNVDRKLLATTACAIAKMALPYVLAGENRPRILLEMIEAWVRGEITAEQVEAASDGALAVANNTGNNAAADAVYSAVKAASVVFSTQPTATHATHHAAQAMPGDYLDNLRQLSHIVHQHIPLHVVLESRT